ncbi:hypothetical protein F5J12DRAFT_723240, partial [Pisolithus orientalis]|uniref:uncharacterized protein n=1 Tax=Pisolithus orientalis TaxID=936130 RepID=UPI002224D84F
NKLSLAALEVLQILKFSFKQDHLTFTTELIFNKQDHSIAGPVSPLVVNELISRGYLEELSSFMQTRRMHTSIYSLI